MQFKNTLLAVIASVALINAAAIPPAAPAAPADPVTSIPVTVNGGDIPETNPDYQTCINQVNAYLTGIPVSTTTSIPKAPDVCTICVYRAYKICVISPPYKQGDLDVATRQCYSNEMLACKSFYKVGPKAPEPKDLASLPALAIPSTPEVPAAAVPAPAPAVPGVPAPAAPTVPGVPAPAAPAVPGVPAPAAPAVPGVAL